MTPSAMASAANLNLVSVGSDEPRTKGRAIPHRPAASRTKRENSNACHALSSTSGITTSGPPN